MKKKLFTFLCTAALAASMTITSLAGTWKPDGSLWWYQEDDGTYPAAAWKSVDGVWYHFNAAGYMETGWVNDNGTWYYMEPSGAMRTAPLTENGLTYFFSKSGACINPEAASLNLSETEMEELNYSLALLGWMTDANVSIDRSAEWETMLNAGQYEKVKAEIRDVKVSINQCNDITPPAKYAEAHKELIAGFADLSSAYDVFYSMVDGMQNGTMSDEQLNVLSDQFYAYTDSSESHLNRFNELADAV